MDIRVEDLVYTYPSGVQALNGISLRIASGESVAIVGQNGAGKTTLVKHFNGLLKPDSGEVRVGDWDTRAHSTARLASRVGYVFQNPDDQLFQSKVLAEVTFGPRNLGFEPDRVSALADQALKMVGLEAVAGQHPYDLSPGERKRVALAAVLSMDTPIIVLDEPTTGQDFTGLQRVGEIVEGLKERGKTILTITHDIDFCAEHFSRVIVMAEGRILLDGDSRMVLAQENTLAETYVDPPQLVRLAKQLGFKQVPLTVKEFVENHKEWIEQK